jgi:hypothetical protein
LAANRAVPRSLHVFHYVSGNGFVDDVFPFADTKSSYGENAYSQHDYLQTFHSLHSFKNSSASSIVTSQSATGSMADIQAFFEIANRASRIISFNFICLITSCSLHFIALPPRSVPHLQAKGTSPNIK